MTDKKNYDEKFGLDMKLEEALTRFANASKEETAAARGKNNALIPEGEAQLVMFQGASIRKILHENEWWFSITDIVGAISESANPRRYWSDLKRQMIKMDGYNELYDEIVRLKMPSADGKLYETDACNTETVLRIIQSMRTPKAEPFKRWLAKVGYERIQEIQNPEIAIKRAILSYQIMGRTDDWIDKRIRSIVTRKELTNEWKKRGIEGMQYGALTNIISMNTFGIDTKGHKRVKGLKSQTLRDHMTDLELIFTMLGEKSTAEIAKTKDAIGFAQNTKAAKIGGKIAGTAREGLEKETGRRIVSPTNFLGSKSRKSDPELLSAPKKKK